MIAAVILAAGDSTRMGSPKALLSIGDKSFVRHIVDAYRGSTIKDIFVVVGAFASEIEHELSGSHVTLVYNKNYRLGQVSSIIAALDALSPLHAEGVLIHPVDHPGVRRSTIQSLVDRFAENHPPVVLPTHKGKRGHPVLFSAKLFDELRNTPPEIGARAVVWSHAKEVVGLATDDEGVVLDIDTLRDYEDFQKHL